AERTKFNGMSLLNGDFAATLDAATSTAKVGEALGNASISNVDVSRASSGTWTFTDNTDGTVTLSDGTRSQIISVDDIAANSTGRLNFEQLGISIEMVAGTADTAANIAADLDGHAIVV